MSDERNRRGGENDPNEPRNWDEISQEEREAMLERAMLAARLSKPKDARTLSSPRKKLTCDHVAAGSIILLPTNACPESVRRKLKTLPSPLPGYMAFRSSDFPKACQLIGLSAKRVRLNPARGFDRCYIGDTNGAWLPPAALWRMSERETQRMSDRVTDTGSTGSMLESLKSTLAKKVVRLQEFEMQAVRLRNALLNGGETGREYDHILKHPNVVGLEVNGKKITVRTGPIEIRYRMRRYIVGEFEIEIDITPEVINNDSTFGVRMRNLTNRKGSCDHPHVERGIPCLGNVKGDLKRLLLHRQFEAVTALCIRYLQTYTHVVNEDEDYKPFIDIENWK